MATRYVSGGDKLTAKLKELSAKVDKPRTLNVGFLAGATYPNGTSVPMVAAIQEFGAPSRGIPPRPYFRTMVAQQSPHWGQSLANLLEAHDYDAEKALTLMGLGIEGELRDSIIALISPPLSPVTLMLRRMRADNPNLVVNATVVAQARAKVAKGDSYSGVSTKPLVDSGWLLSRVASEVV